MPRHGAAPMASHLEPFVLFVGSERGLCPLQSMDSLGELINEPEVLTPFIPCIYSEPRSQGSDSLLMLSLRCTPAFIPLQKLTSCLVEQMYLGGCGSESPWYSERVLGFYW